MSGSRRGAAPAIGAATGLSRILGLVREQLFAGLVGASAFADAYVAAFRIPNLVRDLVAEGALAQAVVPAFAAEQARAGTAAAYQLGNRVGRLVVLAAALLAAMLALAAPVVLALLVGDFALTDGKLELTARLTRIMAGYVPLVALAAVVMAMATAQGHYLAPSLGPALFNLVSIGGAIGLALLDWDPRAVVIGWAVVTVAAGVAQLGLQTVALAQAGWRPGLGPSTPARRRQVAAVGRALVPAMLAVAAVQLNVFVATVVVSGVPGAVACLHYGFRFLQLPLGVFAVAIATVTTTRLAVTAAADDRPAMIALLVSGLRWVILIGVPAGVGLAVDGEAIVRLLYEHGRFTAADTAATSAIVVGLAAGLPAFAAIKVLAPVWFAIGQPRAAVIAALVSVVVNLGLGLVVVAHGLIAIALAIAVAATVNVAWLYVAIDRVIAPLPHRQLADHLGRVTVASVAMAGAVWATGQGLAGVVDDDLAGRAAVALGPVAVGLVTFALGAWRLRIAEVGALIERRR